MMQSSGLVGFRRFLPCVVVCAGAVHLSGQSSLPDTTTAAVLQHHYLAARAVPNILSAFVGALGGGLGKAGQERLILTGTLQNAQGIVPFTFTRELDENVRIDIGGASPRTLIASNLRATPAFSPGMTQGDETLLETLTNDTAEGFLFAFQNGAAFRWLGNRFRTDNGTTANYSGPFYDIYTQSASVAVVPGQAVRHKLYYFDSVSKALVTDRYRTEQGGQAVSVEVSFGGWAPVAGRLTPGTISRKESGTEVFSLTITGSVIAPTQADGLFNVSTQQVGAQI